MTFFQHLYQPTGRELILNNQRYLFFGGTAYLGLLDNPEYISIYKEGIDRYGLNNGTSRSNNVQLGVYDEVEEKLADRFGYECATVFSSGYLAAQATVRSLAGEREVLYAPGCHPALWLEEYHGSDLKFEDWIRTIVDYINSSKQISFMIVSNCMDNLRPAYFDFSYLSLISKEKNIILLLDDSHGIGIVRENGISTCLKVLKNRSNIEVLVVASMAKGLGTDAGLVLGTFESINRIKKHPIFRGASPASPAAMYALLKGDIVYKEALAALQSNIRYFSQELGEASGLNYINSFPVFTSLSSSLYSYLSHCNIVISSFPYPFESSPLLNRIVLSPLHHKSDLDYLLDKYLAKSK